MATAPRNSKDGLSLGALDVNTLLQEIRELRQRIDDGATSNFIPAEITPEVIIVKDPARSNSKRKPTEFKTYNGDRSTYPAWRRAVLSALKMDWNTFEYTDSYVFLKIYEALDGKAQKQAAAYFESGGLRGEERPEDFIAFLDRSNWDPTRITRARGELNEMKMGPKQRWSTFFPLWANKLTEANGDAWPDETKVTMLEGTLNHTMRLALAGNHLLPPDNFFEWVRIVTHVAQRYEVLLKGSNLSHIPSSVETSTDKFHTGNNFKGDVREASSNGWTRPGNRRESVHDVDASGDTIMGGIYS
ncbi:hypothetical protein K3495_g12073, partial [Podosphaera aphanis]